jgi:hypothetical protein
MTPSSAFWTRWRERHRRDNLKESRMQEPVNTFALSPEQQDTAVLLRRLLGKAITDRYIDFCRLAAGAFPLIVSRPMAAHALRELESTLRHVLEVPMEAKASESSDDIARLDEARNQLRALGYDSETVQQALKYLKPRFSHKDQIRKIVTRLGLDPDGDIATKWASLSDSVGKAHERAFHRSLAVDDEFRTRYQQPFDTVIRAVAVALEGRYATLMRRVEEIAAMPNRAAAAAAFASEIPEAMPLQWHFFKTLTTGDWLPHLAKRKLLGEPTIEPEEASNGFRKRQWPAGNYLQRLAESPDPDTRKRVAETLRAVAASKHPDIHQDGLEILAALPPEDSAPLADIAVAWLGRESRFGLLQAPETLVKKLAKGKQREAALRVARALFQLWNDGGEIASLYGRHMYEHHLPSVMQALTEACDEDALRLFMELLLQAADISGKIQYDHHSSRPITDDDMAKHDIYNALISAVRRSAGILIAEDPTRMRRVIGILTENPAKIFVRLALHVVAQNPTAAPDLSDAYVLNPELIEQTWARHEYAELARAWYPSLSPGNQQAVLAVVNAMPDKYRAAWRARFAENNKAPPTGENDRVFSALTIRDALWDWRSVLPPERQQALDDIVAEFGDPDAWRHQLFPAEESPRSGAEFSTRPISENVAFLLTWRPQGDKQLQTITALAQELRTAVGNDPKSYASSADKFVGLKPIYIRRFFEGLQSAANGERDFHWGKVLKLIEFAYSQYGQVIGPATLAEGDDKDWTWACHAASELLAAGLRRGVSGVSFEHAILVRALVRTALTTAPNHPEIEDFEDRFRRESFFAGQATLRGIAVELSILLIFWLSKDASSTIGAAPREALQNLPEIRQALESQLADRSADGRVPRAIIGRFLSWLFFFGESWLRAQMPTLFPADNDGLRRAAWRAHLGRDGGPLRDFVTELHDCYAADIALFASDQADKNFRDFYQDRLADYIMVLHLWDGLPEDLLEQFWRDAPEDVRQHAMWFVGNQVSRPSSEAPDEIKSRGLAYWERRLAAAVESNQPDSYRRELGVISQWCFHGQLDEAWLCEQLLSMLKSGFAPSDAFSVVEWLRNIAPRHVDRAVEVMAALLRHPRVDQWAYMTQREPIRVVLSEGLARGTPATIKRVEGIIGVLSTLGETSYLDLVRTLVAE